MMFKDALKRNHWFRNKIEVKKSSVHGLGVFATCDIARHTCIELAPILCFHKDTMDELGMHTLNDYVFSWIDAQVVIALGYGSLYNHSNDASNVSFQMRTHLPGIEFITKRDIRKGEELLTHYRRGHADVEFTPGGSII